MARDTVTGDTPAWRATSAKVARTLMFKSAPGRSECFIDEHPEARHRHSVAHLSDSASIGHWQRFHLCLASVLGRGRPASRDVGLRWNMRSSMTAKLWANTFPTKSKGGCKREITASDSCGR